VIIKYWLSQPAYHCPRGFVEARSVRDPGSRLSGWQVSRQFVTRKPVLLSRAFPVHGIVLRLRHSTVLDLSRRGILPAFKIGKHWRYRRSDLEEWMAARRDTN